MRRILIVVAAFIAIVILAALAAPSLIDVNKHRPQIEAQLQSKLGRPVSIGALTLRLLPPSVRMDSITIGESPEFPSTKPFATAQDVSAKIELFPLLRGAPVIDSLSFNRPQIELIRNAKGIWNFSTLGESSSSGSQNGVTLNELKLQDGQIALTDN
ncbi:MAG: hypothetical protein JWN63_3090, partial [Candidatus Acidoferrum typicum]|nr:hypothetical protein [Candidatus Acidoferrum typicum]